MKSWYLFHWAIILYHFCYDYKYLPFSIKPYHGILLSSQEDGGQFYRALGNLKFSPAPGGCLAKGLKPFTFFFWGGTRFSLLGGWVESLPWWPKIYSSLSHQEKSPSRLTPRFLLPASKVHPPLNTIFHVITQ